MVMELQRFLDLGQKILFHGGVEFHSKKTFYRLPHLTC